MPLFKETSTGKRERGRKEGKRLKGEKGKRGREESGDVIQTIAE
jgi:hypothetical protein